MNGNGWSKKTSYNTPEFTETDEIFLNEKSSKALILLSGGKKYGSEVSKGIDSTYAHTVGILKKFEKQGLAKTRKEGRKKFYTLTEKGQAKAEALKQVVDAGDENQE